MEKFKNMTNRLLPVELVGRSLSVGARDEFEAEIHEVSPQLRLMLGKQVRQIGTTVTNLVVEQAKEDPKKKPKIEDAEPVPEDAPETILDKSTEPEPLYLDKNQDKGDDSLTTGQNLVELDKEEVPPRDAKHKKDDRRASREKGGR